MMINTTVLLWIILILFFLILLFSFYLVILRVFEVRRNQLKDAYLKRTKDAWIDHLFYKGEWKEEMVPRNRYEMVAAERYLIKLLNTFYVEGTREKIYWFANTYLAGYYKKMLKSPEWSIRMNGLYRVLDFQLKDLAVGHVKRKGMKQPRNPEENYYMALLRIMIGETTVLQLLQEEKRTFSEHQNRALLLKLSHKQMDEMVDNYRYLSYDAKLALVDILGEKNYLEQQRFLVNSIQREPQVELRIRMMKALDRMGFLTRYDPFLPYLQSEFWEERMLAVKLIGTFPLKEVKDELLPMLEDSNWWVRSTTAKMIIRQKNGEAFLKDYQQQTEDTYAYEIIEEQLAKGAMR